jgi:hypothetical protein
LTGRPLTREQLCEALGELLDIFNEWDGLIECEEDAKGFPVGGSNEAWHGKEAMEFGCELMHTSAPSLDGLQSAAGDLPRRARHASRAARLPVRSCISRSIGHQIFQQDRLKPGGWSAMRSGSCVAHVSRTEVSRRVPLRRSHRPAVIAGGLSAGNSGLGQRSAQTCREKAGPWPRAFSEERREARAGADRRRSLRGRSLQTLGDQTAGQVNPPAERSA